MLDSLRIRFGWISGGTRLLARTHSTLHTLTAAVYVHREAHFVGGSLGGIVAQCVAIRYTPRVLSLALISTCGEWVRPILVFSPMSVPVQSLF